MMSTLIVYKNELFNKLDLELVVHTTKVNEEQLSVHNAARWGFRGSRKRHCRAASGFIRLTYPTY